MDSTTMINDMTRKKFGAEPPDQRHSDVWPRSATILDRMFDCAWQQDALPPPGRDFVEGWITQEYAIIWAT